MAKKMQWTIRVVNRKDAARISGLWIEQLRYMGHIRELAMHDDREVLEFCSPAGQDNTVWCEQNAARMRSFGIDAVVAPKWDEERGRCSVQTSGALNGYMERLNRAGV